MSADMKTLRKALSKMHARACGDTGAVYMSVPARPDVDADLLLAAALDELEALRAENKRLDRLLAVCNEVHGHNVRLKAQRDELLAAAEACLASASPNPVDHPAMARAWRKAETTIARVRGGQ